MRGDWIALSTDEYVAAKSSTGSIPLLAPQYHSANRNIFQSQNAATLARVGIDAFIIIELPHMLIITQNNSTLVYTWLTITSYIVLTFVGQSAYKTLRSYQYAIRI